MKINLEAKERLEFYKLVLFSNIQTVVPTIIIKIPMCDFQVGTCSPIMNDTAAVITNATALVTGTARVSSDDCSVEKNRTLPNWFKVNGTMYCRTKITVN